MATQSLSNKTFDRIPFLGSNGLPLGNALKRILLNAEIWWLKRQAYRATLKELSALNDRELDDIGIVRADIRSIARQSADIAVSRHL